MHLSTFDLSFLDDVKGYVGFSRCLLPTNFIDSTLSSAEETFYTAVMTPHFFATKPKLEIKSSNIGSLVKYKALSIHYSCNAKFSSRNTHQLSTHKHINNEIPSYTSSTLSMQVKAKQIT